MDKTISQTERKLESTTSNEAEGLSNQSFFDASEQMPTKRRLPADIILRQFMEVE